jgi:hypothetical protein
LDGGGDQVLDRYKTPRTDIAAMRGLIDNDFDGGLMPAEVVSAKFARKLEMEITQLRKERDEARRRICETTDMTNPNDDCYVRLTPQQIAEHYGWDCYKEPYCFRVNGVVISKEKAVPPKFELGEDDE